MKHADEQLEALSSAYQSLLEHRDRLLEERASLERSAWLTNRAAAFVTEVCLGTLQRREYDVVRAVVDAATAEACPALSRLIAAAVAFAATSSASAEQEAELRAAAAALSAAYRDAPTTARPA